MVTLTVTHPLTMSLHIGVELPEELRVKKKKKIGHVVMTLALPDGSGVEFQVQMRAFWKA